MYTIAAKIHSFVDSKCSNNEKLHRTRWNAGWKKLIYVLRTTLPTLTVNLKSKSMVRVKVCAWFSGTRVPLRSRFSCPILYIQTRLIEERPLITVTGGQIGPRWQISFIIFPRKNPRESSRDVYVRVYNTCTCMGTFPNGFFVFCRLRNSFSFLISFTWYGTLCLADARITRV